MSQNGLTRMPGEACRWKAGMSSSTNERPMKKSPAANFVGVDGSYFPRRIHIQANAGASTMTKIACTLANQLDGKLTPANDVRVYRSANRLSVDPACSYAPQNTAANTKKTAMAASRFHSTLVKPPKVGSADGSSSAAVPVAPRPASFAVLS